LILLNDPLVADLARQWGARALQTIPDSAGNPVVDRVTWLYESGFSRAPTTDEVQAALVFVQARASSRDVSIDDANLWGDLAHALVNTKEFIFLR
jgi:hypothetical protein